VTGLEPALRDGLPIGFEGLCATLTLHPHTQHFDMAKGISSKNSLKALAYPLQQFISGWGVREKPSAPKPNTAGRASLPAPYELAALRGEGILRERFFGAFMQKLPVALDASQQIAAWQSLVEDGGHITAWVERLGVAKALRREAQIGVHANTESRKLYSVLLDAIQAQSSELLPWAVEGYFWHCWKQQFPSTPNKQDGEGTTDTALQHTRLLRELRKRHGNGVEIKESFVQSSEAVDFSVLWRKDQAEPWQTLHQVSRPRLKTARLAAYGEATKELNTTPL
jgi:hypothetical protein